MKIVLKEETRVGWHVDNSRRVPIYWAAGTWDSDGMEGGSVGGTWTGYSYQYFRHLETGRVESLKSHQIDALKEMGLVQD